MVEKLSDPMKTKLADALKELEGASRHLRSCLMVEIKGFGIYDQDTVTAAVADFAMCRDAVEKITEP